MTTLGKVLCGIGVVFLCASPFDITPYPGVALLVGLVLLGAGLYCLKVTA